MHAHYPAHSGLEKQMKRQMIYLDELLGRKVYDIHGKCAGRIEEALASTRGECTIDEFHLGRVGLFERLSIAHFANHLLRVVGATGNGASHRVPCDQLDLTDPRRPRLRCAASELKKIK